MSSTDSQRSFTAQSVSKAIEALSRDFSWRSYGGPNIDRLIEWFGVHTRSSQVRLCCSGTMAVEIALRALHLKSTDEVVLSSYDFPGNFRAIEDVGAKVVLCDPAPDSGWVLTPERLEQVVAPATRAVIVSHLHGQLAPMRQLKEWSRSAGVVLIEDACQAHGGHVDGQPVGSWGDLAVFSLGGSKLVSAGRGGVVVTNDELYAQRMRVFCERGNDAFALSELQATVAIAQCERMEADHQLRLESAHRLRVELSRLEWLACPDWYLSPDDSPAFYKVGLNLQTPDGTQSSLTNLERLRDTLLLELQQRGLEVGVGFRSFASRSAKRFRSPHSLEQGKRLAASTIVIHHSMLLDPLTGANRVSELSSAVQLVGRKLFA